MSLGEIFSDAVHYPFGDMTKYIIVGIFALLSSLSTVLGNFGVDSVSILLIASIIGFVFTLILSGYGVDVIKRGIQHSDEIPDIDLMTNLINGVKALIIGLVYFIIPIIITFILMAITGVIGKSLDHALAGLGIGMIIAVIVFIAFAIFETIALARFADTGDLGAALSIGDVIEDVKRIGIVKILGYVIIAFLILIVAFVIAGLLGMIPYIGIIIATILAGGFVILFTNKALGLLYADA